MGTGPLVPRRHSASRISTQLRRQWNRAVIPHGFAWYSRRSPRTFAFLALAQSETHGSLIRRPSAFIGGQLLFNLLRFNLPTPLHERVEKSRPARLSAKSRRPHTVRVRRASINRGRYSRIFRSHRRRRRDRKLAAEYDLPIVDAARAQGFPGGAILATAAWSSRLTHDRILKSTCNERALSSRVWLNSISRWRRRRRVFLCARSIEPARLHHWRKRKRERVADRTPSVMADDESCARIEAVCRTAP